MCIWMDGGLADNIGLRAIADEYRQGFIRKRINFGEIEKLVIIAVNARTAPSEGLDTRARPPGLLAVAYKTATISLDNYSFETVEMMRELAGERERAQRVLEDCQQEIDARCPGSPPLPPLAGGHMKPYVIELNFDGVTDPAERECFLSLPTNFALSQHQVTALIEVAAELLDAHPKFQELLQELGKSPQVVPTRTTNCRQNP
jgi:NTE family protein